MKTASDTVQSWGGGKLQCSQGKCFATQQFYDRKCCLIFFNIKHFFLFLQTWTTRKTSMWDSITLKPKTEWLIKKSLLFIMRLAGWTANTIYPFASLGQLAAPSCPALTIELPLCQPRSLSNLCNLNAVPQLIYAIEKGLRACVRPCLLKFVCKQI